jgi:hypothetical protein
MDWSTTRELQDIDYFTSLEQDKEKENKIKQDEIERLKEELLNTPDIHLTLRQLREARVLRLSQKTIQNVDTK